MRRDFEIHINTGDITLPSQAKYELHDFSWVSNPNGLTRYIYGEIVVPAALPLDSIWSKGLYFVIPYTGKYKEFYIRIKRVYSETNSAYVQNPVDGSDWFLVKTALYGGEFENAFASQLLRISENAFFLMLEGGIAKLYSAEETDLNVVKANRQNTNMMLACVPTNNYRYPVTGVGLIRWQQSNMIGNDLSNVLQQEFSDDGTPVISASYDFNTRQLYLQLDTTNADATN